MPDDRIRTPQYLLELAAAGELDPERSTAILERAGREQGEDPLAALARDAAETFARLPPAEVAAEVARRAAGHERRPTSSWLLIPVLCATAVAAIAIPLVRMPASRVADAEAVRSKGLSPQLVVHRQTSVGAERVAPGGVVRPGDLVQLGYISAGNRFGVIVSLDGRGGVTRHFPPDGASAAALTSGREVLLPESFRLDEAPRFERFIFVTADHPFEVARVLEATRALATRPDARDARLTVAGDLFETSLVVSKETP
jgi:hypothetical protein